LIVLKNEIIYKNMKKRKDPAQPDPSTK